MIGPLFVRNIASLLPGLSWRHFGVGALQAYLCEGAAVEQRLHIWHPSLVRPGISGFGDCHDHRFSFISEVLCGEIINRHWDILEKPLGRFDLYRVENARRAHARTGKHDGICEVVSRCDAWIETTCRVPAGASYEFRRGRFHQSQSLGLTITLVTKFDQVDSPARILCPHGAELVHAFGSPAPDVSAIVAHAVAALEESLECPL